MQPAAAIPPYDPETLKQLIGISVAVPMSAQPQKVWWVRIAEVKFISANTAAVRCGGHRSYGKDKWYSLAKVRFKSQCYEPIALAIHKARATAAPRK